MQMASKGIRAFKDLLALRAQREAQPVPQGHKDFRAYKDLKAYLVQWDK
jgi:hypothetical protein